MQPLKQVWRKHRSLRLHVYGQGLILLGAQLMHSTGSMLPLAMGASAAVMLTVPLVRQLLAPRHARVPRD
jgi:hypothetical protein